MQVGDFVKGKPESDAEYSNTNSAMTRGVIVDVLGDGRIMLRILEHEKGNTGKYEVESKYFEVIGHVKPFSREAVLELLKKGCKKAILDYDLSDADLSGANIDFSCMPLRCGGLKWCIDKRIACQLAYHLCSMQCDDEEFIRLKNFALPFANQFHRVGDDCELLELVEVGK